MSNYMDKIKPNYKGYQELHVHTEGSFRDAVNTVSDVFDAAEQFGRNAVAITDHGNWTRLFEALKERTKREKKVLEKELEAMNVPKCDIEKSISSFGNFDSVRNPSEKMMPWVQKYEAAFVETARKAVQFVPGIEMYESVNYGKKNASRHHICLYAKDWEGVKVLFALNNSAQLSKVKNIPCCTEESLRKFIGEGSRGHNKVVATSACIGGRIQSELLKPFRLIEKQQKLKDKIDKMTVIDSNVLAGIEKEIQNIEKMISEKKDWLLNAKKICGRKWDTAISRAEKALLKAETKVSKNQISFNEQVDDNDDIETAKLALEQAKQNAELAQEYAVKIPEETQKIEELKQKLKQHKANLTGLLKQNEPAQKIQQKIDELQVEMDSLGDVYESAKKVALIYNEIFGQGNFFIELQDHNIFEEKTIRHQLIQIAKETGIPLTVANDVHFKTKEDERKRAIVAALRYPEWTIQNIMDKEGNDQLYFKSNEEMMALFSDVPQAIENTSRIAEMCNVFYKKELHFPKFVDEKWHLSPENYLSQMAHNNILVRYPDFNSWDKKRIEDFNKRLEYELGIINSMGYASYISIVENFITYAKTNFSENAVGPGRGSGAGSLVCYLVGITNIDPLRYSLIFERFLNPERVSLPDIDVDFAPSIRSKIVEYVANRYAYKGDYWAGKELSGTTCNIYTEGTLAARNAIRQAGKVTGVTYAVCDRVAKLIPATPGITLKKAMDTEKALKGLYEQDVQVKSLIDDAMLVEGIPVQTGIHAAGVIIADKPITEYAPMFFNDEDNCWVIQFDMVSCEADAGLVKMDFLGLKNLDILLRASKFIASTQNKAINFKIVNKAEDLSVIDDIYATGRTNGVFQFESDGMKQTLKSFSPKNIDDVILLNAAYRPGPMQYIPEVTDVKSGKKDAHYVVPEMANILDVTYGSPIYQEQIQQIFHEIAGFSLGQADIIRRAMSKKHLDELEAAKDGFVQAFLDKGAKQEDIETFWSQLLAFASYAFNKSHAAAYSVLSYYTAFVKKYFPVEYMASLISYSENESLTLYSKELRDLNISLLGPDVNKSIVYTAPNKNGQIRYGLGHIKGVAAAADKIVGERKIKPYENYEDFIIRCAIIGVGKKAVESLIISGSIDSILSINRQSAFMNADNALKACRDAIKKSGLTTRDELYQYLSDKNNFVFPVCDIYTEYPQDEILRLEKDVTGMYVSGHPLDKYKDLLEKQYAKNIAEIPDEGECLIAGYVSSLKKMKSKKDNSDMCALTLEDFTGEIEVLVFPYAYKTYGNQFSEGSIAVLQGTIKSEKNDEGDVISKKIFASKGRKLT